MEALLWIAGLAAVLAVSALASHRGVATGPRQQRAVLPSHYDAWNYLPSRPVNPGICPDCGAENEPEYDFCQACAAKLPARPAVDRDPIRRLQD